MTKRKTDVIVIGAGPGGYVAAIRLAQLHRSVTLIEKDNLGGVCLNWGCIPSKALIHVARLYEELQHVSQLGLSVGQISLDLGKMQEWKSSVVKRLATGIAQLCKIHGVDVIKGVASFATDHHVLVRKMDQQEEMVEFDHAIVACGSRPLDIPGFPVDGTNVADSQHALAWTTIPPRLLVIGGGVIGLELGMLYQKLGSETSIVELTDQLLPGFDGEVASTMARICRRKRIPLHLSSKAVKYTRQNGCLSISINTPKGQEEILADIVLLAVGRVANADGLNVEKIGVTVEKGVIPVDISLRTTVPHIYAIGDVTGPPLLAHKASRQGILAAEIIVGHATTGTVNAIPGAVFTDPEIATVGMTEAEARCCGKNILIGKFPLAASGRALASAKPDGFIKIIAEKDTHKILGGHIVGESACELIGEISLAMQMNATLQDLAHTIRPHPTISEAITEAADAALGKAIHGVRRQES